MVVYWKYLVIEELSPSPTNMVGGWPKIDGRWDFEVGCANDSKCIIRSSCRLNVHVS